MIPSGAKTLLDFIAHYEAPHGYDTVYGNNQNKLPKKLTLMTVGEIIDSGSEWTTRFGSSACGRYQFMRATLKGLVAEGHCKSVDRFSPSLQDKLGFALLQRRGYSAYIGGHISKEEFAKRLAMEWASMPVLIRTKGAHRIVQAGETYYAGDRLNKALVSTQVFSKALDSVKGKRTAIPTPYHIQKTAGIAAVITAVITGIAMKGQAILCALPLIHYLFKVCGG